MFGPWFPGAHCGYSSVIGPACTGIDRRILKTCCDKLLASTCSAIVPGYGASPTAGSWAEAGRARVRAKARAGRAARAKKVRDAVMGKGREGKPGSVAPPVGLDFP
ncbi:hypothetical protein GCM10009094_23530 [Massilia aurea]